MLSIEYRVDLWFGDPAYKRGRSVVDRKAYTARMLNSLLVMNGKRLRQL